MRKFKFLLKTLALLIGFTILLVGFSTRVEAEVGSVHGLVYFEFNGNKIPLPGVRVRRTDGNFMRSIEFIVRDGEVVDTNEVFNTCPEHVTLHSIAGYDWNNFKYKCSHDIPQTWIDGPNRPNTRYYDSDDCRLLCDYQECIYEAKKVCDGVNPCEYVPDPGSGFYVCDSEGITNLSCKTKCIEFGAHCTQLVRPPASAPSPTPTDQEFIDNNANAIGYICRGGETRTEKNQNGVETTSTNHIHAGLPANHPSAANWHMTASYEYFPSNPNHDFVNNPAPYDPLSYDIFESAVCPDGTAGNVSMKAPEELNYCGLNCIENPHRLRAYFTDATYDFIQNNYPAIPIDRSDPKAGGRWQLRSDGSYTFKYHEKDPTLLKDDPLQSQWDLQISYRDVWGDRVSNQVWEGYQPTEYYEPYIGNYEHWYGFNFEWVPPAVQHDPKLTSIPQENTPWIGDPRIERVLDPSGSGNLCSDNNPYVFKFEGSDEDGASDIDFIEFNLAKNIGALSYKNWPLRLMFARKLMANGTSYADNAFMVRDKQVTNTTNPRCYSSVTGTLGGFPGTTNVWCMKAGNHSWETAERVVQGGKETFWLKDDITIYGDGYSITLIGTDVGWWGTNTYVSFDESGDNVEGQFKIQFNGDESSNWNGYFHQLWRISDLTERQDETANIGSESIEELGGSHFHRLAQCQLDFIPPTITLEKPVMAEDNHIQMEWSAIDTGGSGLLSMRGEALHSSGAGVGTLDDITARTRGDQYISDEYKPWDSGHPDFGHYEDSVLYSPHLWSVQISSPGTNNYPNSGRTMDEIDLNGINEGTLTLVGEVVDHACNIGDSPSSVEHVSYLPWLMTQAGLVYSGDSYNIKVQSLAGTKNLCPDDQQGCTPFNTDPFDITRNNVGLSSELLSSGTTINSESKVNKDLTKMYMMRNYADDNNQSWFETVKANAVENVTENQDHFSYEPVVLHSLPALASACDNGDAPCLIHVQTNLTLGGYVCDKRALILVEGNMTIRGNITAGGDTYGCIFVVKGNVTIDPIRSGDYGDAYPRYDNLEAFIISDGQVIVNPSPDYYGLQVYGSLLGFGGVSDGVSLDFARSIKNDHSATSPSIFTYYDPRYLHIANKFLFEENFSHETEVGVKN